MIVLSDADRQARSRSPEPAAGYSATASCRPACSDCASSTVVTLATGRMPRGRPALEEIAFSSPLIRSASADAASWVCTPPHDFHDASSLLSGTRYIKMGWISSGLPLTANGLCGSHRSGAHAPPRTCWPGERTGIPMPAAIPAVMPRNVRLSISQQHMASLASVWYPRNLRLADKPTHFPRKGRMGLLPADQPSF